MKRLVRGLLLGGLVSAAIAAIRSYQDDEPIDELVANVSKAAAIGASLGAATGLVSIRRSRRKAKKVVALATYALAGKKELRSLKKNTATNVHKFQSRFETAKDIAADVRDIAVPLFESIGEQAKPVAKEAAHNAIKAAHEVKEATRPYASDAKDKAVDAAGSVRPHAKKAARKAARHAYRQAHKAKSQQAALRAADKADEAIEQAKALAIDIREKANKLADSEVKSHVVVKNFQ